MQTVLDILQKAEGYFREKGVPNPKIDAEWIVAHVLGKQRLQLFLEFERPLTEAELDGIRPLVRRRARREPLQHILGTTPFCGLSLKTDPRSLVPRPETEELVEWIVEAESNPPPKCILDLGTGSGAIALALAAAFPRAAVTAVDVSPDALALAQENAAANELVERVTFHESDWYAGLSGQTFDLVVANPPYLSDAEVASAEPEVREFEPREALVSADAGTAALKAIIAGFPDHARPGARLYCETGIAQEAFLRETAEAAGLTDLTVRKDRSHRPRLFRAKRVDSGV
ncbi:MAG: peptide chain release factor N(5)-glutamine methyltransferase [Opitutales bacterium]